jgi:hypothetical protein
MSTPNPLPEEIELEGDPELESPDLPELPPDLRAVLLRDFPPGNKSSSGFASGLINLMTAADPYNLARLFEVFPVYGVAFMLWDEGLIEYSPDRRNVTFKADQADKASILDMPDWHDKCATFQSVLNYSRTTDNGRVLTDRDLGKATHFGSY